jgi:hypothetical protein
MVRLGVTSGHVGAGQLPVSVDKRRQRWFGLSERSPLTMAGTMEQEVTKETKNTGVETLFSDLIRGASDPRSPARVCEVLTLRCLYYLLFKEFLCLTRIGRWFRLREGAHKADERRGQGDAAGVQYSAS